MDETSSNQEGGESPTEQDGQTAGSGGSEGLEGNAANSFDAPENEEVDEKSETRHSGNLNEDVSDNFEKKSKESLEEGENDSKLDDVSARFAGDVSSSFDDSEIDESKESEAEKEKRGQEYKDWVENGNRNEILNACENDPKTKEFADYVKDNNVKIVCKDLGIDEWGHYDPDTNTIFINGYQSCLDAYSENPDLLKANFVHEASHSMGFGEIDARINEVRTGYSDEETKRIVLDEAGAERPRRHIAQSLLQMGYSPNQL